MFYLDLKYRTSQHDLIKINNQNKTSTKTLFFVSLKTSPTCENHLVWNGIDAVPDIDEGRLSINVSNSQ